jgi:hypothetical protein
MTSKAKTLTNDLFITTLHELHSEAPAELLNSLRAQLRQIKSTNPNCAQTAEACLEGLASDKSSLLHVLTAAYLINGGVMIKHQAAEQLAEEEEKPYMGSEFDSLEEELNRFSISIDGSLKTPAKPFTGSLQAQSALQPRPELAQDTPGDPSAHS